MLAEVIEIQAKPSMPEGPTSTEAFARVPQWEDLGLMRRAILAIGEQDVGIEGLQPKWPGVRMVRASSDHLVVAVT